MQASSPPYVAAMHGIGVRIAAVQSNAQPCLALVQLTRSLTCAVVKGDVAGVDGDAGGRLPCLLLLVVHGIAAPVGGQWQQLQRTCLARLQSRGRACSSSTQHDQHDQHGCAQRAHHQATMCQAPTHAAGRQHSTHASEHMWHMLQQAAQHSTAALRPLRHPPAVTSQSTAAAMRPESAMCSTTACCSLPANVTMSSSTYSSRPASVLMASSWPERWAGGSCSS
jgi:hypothetical protein